MQIPSNTRTIPVDVRRRCKHAERSNSPTHVPVAHTRRAERRLYFDSLVSLRIRRDRVQSVFAYLARCVWYFSVEAESLRLSWRPKSLVRFPESSTTPNPSCSIHFLVLFVIGPPIDQFVYPFGRMGFRRVRRRPGCDTFRPLCSSYCVRRRLICASVFDAW
jgi:hypothetical protein